MIKGAGKGRIGRVLAVAVLAFGLASVSPAHADGNRSVTAMPGGILVQGAWVQISFAGYSPNASLTVVVCSSTAINPAVACDWPDSAGYQLTNGATSGVLWGQFFSARQGTFACDLYNPCRAYVLENPGDLINRAAFAPVLVSVCQGCVPAPQVSASPSSGVSDHQTITVSWSGVSVGAPVMLIECSGTPQWATRDCDPSTAKQVVPPDGATSGSALFDFLTTSETTFTCNALTPCRVYVLENRFDLASAAAYATVGGQVGRGLRPTGRALQRFVAANMTSTTMTQAQAVAMATANDVISAHPGMFQSSVGAMKAANPNLVLLVYINGTFAQKTQGTAYPSSWYLHDAAGHQVASTGFGNFAMDPTNPAWVQDRVATCRTMMAASGYDGCFVDMLGPAPTRPGYLTALAINAATGQPWTPQEWLAATAPLQAAIASGVSPAPVVGNGLSSGTAYFDTTAPTSQLLTAGAGDMAESWMRPGGQPATAYPSQQQWQQNVDLLASSASSGADAFVCVKLWAGGTQPQVDAWHKFALASFLLGATGTQYFEFSSGNNPTGILSDSAWDHVPLGTPAGAYLVANGIYQRSFTNGVVLVNPASGTSTVTLPFTMYDLNHTAVSSVTLGPQGAEILTLS